MLDKQLLKLLSTRDGWDKYAHVVSKDILQPETVQLMEDFKYYFELYKDDDTLDAGKLKSLVAVTLHPGWKVERLGLYYDILDSVDKETTDETVLERLNELHILKHIEEVVHDLTYNKSKTSKQLEDIINLISANNNVQVEEDEYTYRGDIEEILKDLDRDGLRWYIDELNDLCGPLSKGDLVLIGKRPEVGGTSFLISQFVYMLPQLPAGKKAIIFNNEEAPHKLTMRIAQAISGKDTVQISQSGHKVKQQVKDYLGERDIEIYHRPGMHIRDVERKLKSGDYGLIGINILSKVAGFKGKEDMDKLEALGHWARILSDEYGPVFVVHQADGTAEGQKILDQSQLYKSKTALQQEIDFQIMIGKTHDLLEQQYRYINVVKRKSLLGGHRNAGQRKTLSPVLKVSFNADNGCWGISSDCRFRDNKQGQAPGTSSSSQEEPGIVVGNDQAQDQPC